LRGHFLALTFLASIELQISKPEADLSLCEIRLKDGGEGIDAGNKEARVALIADSVPETASKETRQ
jgi:hypothetical protein